MSEQGEKPFEENPIVNGAGEKVGVSFRVENKYRKGTVKRFSLVNDSGLELGYKGGERQRVISLGGFDDDEFSEVAEKIREGLEKGTDPRRILVEIAGMNAQKMEEFHEKNRAQVQARRPDIKLEKPFIPPKSRMKPVIRPR